MTSTVGGAIVGDPLQGGPRGTAVAYRSGAKVIDETGTRRLLVETFSREEARLFAKEVIPALKQRNATAAEED